jgi:polyhydroxyalkanoate depolymerase
MSSRSEPAAGGHHRSSTRDRAAVAQWSVPAFWPMAMAAALAETGVSIAARNLRFVEEEMRLHDQGPPAPATPHRQRLDLRTMRLLEYGVPGDGVPTLVDAPYAGHTAAIADYHAGQSLIATLRAAGLPHVLLTDWKAATPDMKDLDIDGYLAELLAVVDDLGGRVHLVGLCQGGWLSTMLAARYPDKVASLVLAGAPIDTGAGDGPLQRIARSTPLSFYEELVELGGGRMQGRTMLQGWKGMHPAQHYIQDLVDLYEHIDDPAYLGKRETFERWYESPIDLPGRWYLQAIDRLFQRNLLARGEYVALGRRLDLKAIRCPLYLLAGADDDITPPPQVMAAAHLFGTPSSQVVRHTAPGGHIGLFMGARTLREHWPAVGRWIVSHGAGSPVMA